jgi:hypothetical protein
MSAHVETVRLPVVGRCRHRTPIRADAATPAGRHAARRWDKLGDLAGLRHESGACESLQHDDWVVS